MQQTQDILVQSLGQEDPLEEGMASPPASLPRESHGQRSLGATVHRVTNSLTHLKQRSTHSTHTLDYF